MTKNELIKEITEGIKLGRSKQDIFEHLKSTTNLTPDFIANTLKTVPTIQSKAKMMPINIILITLFSILALSKIYYAYSLFRNEIAFFPYYNIFLAILYFFLVYQISIVKYGAHRAIGIITLMGIIRTFGTLLSEANIINLLDLGYLIIIVALSFFLHSRYFKDYDTYKEVYQNEFGQNRIRKAYEFKE